MESLYYFSILMVGIAFINISSSTSPNNQLILKTLDDENNGLLSAFKKINFSNHGRKPASFYGLSKPENGDLTKNSVMFENVEFGVTGARRVSAGFQLDNEISNEQLVFRIDREDGQIISTMHLKSDASDNLVVNATVVPVKGSHDLYVSNSNGLNASDITWFQFEVSGPNPLDSYVLLSKSNGMALGQINAVVIGVITFVSPYRYGQDQMFSFEKTVYGSYFIKSRRSGHVLEVLKSQYPDNTAVAQTQKRLGNQTQDQEWYVDPTEEGSVKIMSRFSGKCLTSVLVDTSNYLYLSQCTGLPNCRWYLVPVC